MFVEPVHTDHALAALEPEWLDLLRRAPDATPFQRPEWLLPWWKTFGSGKLFCFAVRDGQRLIAFAPMFLHDWRERRQVTFLGNGVSDYLGFLVDPAHASEAVEAIIDAVAHERHRWDLCDLQDLSGSNLLADAATCDPLDSALRPQYTCSSLALPATSDEFHAGLPHGLRRNLRRYREQLERQGRLSFETTRDPGAISEPFDALIELHSARWESKDHGPGMICGSSMRLFHRSAAVNLARSGFVRMHAIRIDGRLIAVLYAWIDRGRVYSYLTGFDPAFGRFSPGALVLQYAIEQSITEGARIYDMLRGDEPYKLTWGARTQTTYRLLLWHADTPVDLLGAA